MTVLLLALGVDAALAEPEVLKEGPAAVGSALSGPDGCWNVEGHARWVHTWGGRRTEGDARFWARFDDHAWRWWRVTDRTEHIDWNGADPELLASRQFRSQIGDDTPSVLSLHGPAVLLRGPPFTGDPGGLVAETKERADGIELVDPGTGALVQEWTLTGRRTERCRTGFHPGTTVPAEVRCDQDPHVSGIGSGMEADRHFFFDGDGLPTEEVLTSAGRLLLGAESTTHHRLRYDAWTACPDDPEAATAFVPEEAVELLPDVDPRVVLQLDPEVPPLEQTDTLLVERHRIARRRFREQLILTSLSGALTGSMVALRLSQPELGWEPADAVPFAVGLGFSAAGLSIGTVQLVRQGRQVRRAKRELEAHRGP